VACLKRAKNRAVLRKCLGIFQVLHVVCPFMDYGGEFVVNNQDLLNPSLGDI